MYLPESLPLGSNKTICILCDYCTNEYESTPKRIKKARAVIEKDACSKCKYIKMKEMNIAKYGVSNVFMLDETKSKIKQTCREKYGEDHHLRNKDVLKKREQSSLQKYGCVNPMQSESAKEQYRNTCRTRYGVSNTSSLPDVKQKRKETNLKKFGSEYYLKSEACIEATINAIGVDNPFKLQKYQDAARQTILEKYGVDHCMKVPEIRKKSHAKGRESRIKAGQIKIFQGKGIPEWSEIVGFSKSAFNTIVNEHGWEAAIRMTPRVSSLELSMQKILDSLHVSYDTQKKIDNYFIDFVVGNIAIECDGLYWHSEHNKKRNYHREKMMAYRKNGLTPLFFREDEIINSPHIVKSIIQNKLFLSNRIFARKCTACKVEKGEGSSFMRENHLMGAGSGDCYALKFNGEIVAMIRMKKIKSGYEVSRFATKLATNVVGAFSKLLSYFYMINGKHPITTFIDLRYGHGEYLQSLGFEHQSTHLSFKWTDGKRTTHRMTFRSNSGYDHNLYKIWDCGQAKYVKR